MSRRTQTDLLAGYKRLPKAVRNLLIRWGTPSFHVGAICVVERADGRILLVRQSYRRDGWDFPGGLLRRSEEPADAARREELGIDVELERLWAKLPEDAVVTVVLEPTRNAWVPLAAWLRAVRLRSSLVKRRTATAQRLDALIELLGPAWADILGSCDYTKSALAVLERYADPRALKKLGRKRLTTLLIRASRGAWQEAKADELLAGAEESIELWAAGGLDFEELADDIATEVRLLRNLNGEIAAMEDRIEALYEEADPKGIVVSTPGIGVTLSAGILGRLGDPNRFANLAGVRSFTGIVPKIDQSGLANKHKGLTKARDPGLREALFLAADLARKVDPTLAERYHRLVVEEGRHHTSAVCTLAAVMATRIAACWRRGELYVLRDVDGTEITEAQGRAICAERYKVTAEVRAARKRASNAQQLKKRAGRGSKESTKAAPASDPPADNAMPVAGAA